MFDLFTDRARKILVLAKEEMRRYNHEYMGTEHILLAIMQEGKGVAVNVLHNLNMDLNKIRHEVEKLVQVGPPIVTLGQYPFTPRLKHVFELAKEESSRLGHHHIGTEHLLLGLVRENDGVAAGVLLGMGLTLENVREAVSDLTGASVKRAPAETPPTEPFVLTRQNVRRRLAELRKKGASKELRGRIEELEAISSALPQDDAIPELGSALTRISTLRDLIATADKLVQRWKDGVISDEEFIVEVKAITF